jgi:PAS domain S-box-containing protein
MRGGATFLVRSELPIAVVGGRIVPVAVSTANEQSSPPEISLSKLQSLIQDMDGGALIVDASGQITCANPAARTMFGFPRLEGRMVEELMPSTLRDAHRVYRSVYASMPNKRPMTRYPYLWAQHADGTEFCVQIELTPFATAAGTWIAALIRHAPPEAE